MSFTKPKNDVMYRLVDLFSLFWLKYVENNNTKDEYFWTNRLDDGGRRAWSGHDFEQLCLHHVSQMKNELGISGVSTSVYTWRSIKARPGVQIDLLIDRKDGVINLCEMKFSLHPISISKQIDQDLQLKRSTFLAETNTRKAIHTTMVTTYGLTESGYRAAVQSEVTLDDLFD
ncbi:MAG: hypothetical protein LBU61_01290 [Coriobacteriales bacterium]|jgi:hypothetical protein|nr:hypothetical protein [Coriobacteriales bacterium]